jgi:bleomycin hydrolase
MTKYLIVLFLATGLISVRAQSIAPKIIKQIDADSVKFQGATNVCWSFSTTSLIESGQILNRRKNIDLSELFTARRLYIEKAKRYILSNGTTLFEAGGLAHDALYVINIYGAMPNQCYPRKKGVDFSVSSKKQLDEILKSYLDSVLKTKPINPDWLTGFIKRHDDITGTPPAVFTFEGKQYTPLSFAKEVLDFNSGDYISITSFTHHPFNQNFQLEIPDNFLLHANYLNVPLDTMINIVSETVQKGYSLVVDMDVTNNGWNCRKSGYALFEKTRFNSVENPDTLEMGYSQSLRQHLFETLETEDDHLIHIVGIAKSKNGKLFFILKDSQGSAYGPFNGYDYISVNYFAINAISILVPKNALRPNLIKLAKESNPVSSIVN